MGLERGTVELEPHDPAWTERAELEATRLHDRGDDRLLAVEHVGSTAVAGIPAKPIIDLLAVAEPGSLEPVTATLAEAGYERRPNDDVPDRIFLARGPAAERTHYLSVTERGSDTHREQVAFRDYLREKPDVAAAYAELKRELSAASPEDRDAYTEGKAAFVERITERALDR